MDERKLNETCYTDPVFTFGTAFDLLCSRGGVGRRPWEEEEGGEGVRGRVGVEGWEVCCVTAVPAHRYVLGQEKIINYLSLVPKFTATRTCSDY